MRQITKNKAMIISLGLLTRKLIESFSGFLVIGGIIIVIFDISFKSVLDLIAKVFVGFGSVVCLVGFTASTLIIGWGTYLYMKFIVQK